uniref:Uncharacterized protein n=1 Tax=Vespula pensylvanica TaxID=30213 RepID=A0A834PDD2_VESPE|nr:hypothetical protein H0235_000038 [Vespula pensylvanica]
MSIPRTLVEAYRLRVEFRATFAGGRRKWQLVKLKPSGIVDDRSEHETERSNSSSSIGSSRLGPRQGRRKRDKGSLYARAPRSLMPDKAIMHASRFDDEISSRSFLSRQSVDEDFSARDESNGRATSAATVIPISINERSKDLEPRSQRFKPRIGRI